GSRRSWALEVGAGTPQDVSTVEALSREPGPLVFVSPDAAVGNLLSPQASGFDDLPVGATDAGLVGLPDGSVARSVAHSGVLSVGVAHGGYEGVPVRPGEVVSVGGWGRGGIRFTGNWRDANGATVSAFSQGAHSFTGWGWRAASITKLAGASCMQLVLSTGTQYALPSVSWGDTAAREIGSGCPKAVVHSPEFSPIAAHSRLNLSRITYSVTEVG